MVGVVVVSEILFSVEETVEDLAGELFVCALLWVLVVMQLSK